MKRILFAFMVALTICSLTNAQGQTKVNNDSVETVNAAADNNTKAAKKNAGSTAVTVVGIDATDDILDEDSSNVQASRASSRGAHTSVTIDDNLFDMVGSNLSNAFVISILTIILVFGFPIFVIFIIFFFRYKNRKARYRLVEQALASGQPLPDGFLKEQKLTDQRSQGIRTTFTGIGLFIFLWAITGTFGIGAIGLLIMFTGIGQWLTGLKQERQESKPCGGKDERIVVDKGETDDAKNEENR